jgi:hypothetical protein
MKKSGKISTAEYDSAKREIASLNDAKIDELNSKAISLIRKNPDKATALYNKDKIDFKEVEKALSE